MVKLNSEGHPVYTATENEEALKKWCEEQDAEFVRVMKPHWDKLENHITRIINAGYTFKCCVCGKTRTRAFDSTEFRYCSDTCYWKSM
jgi:hypothetical protein